MSSLTYMDCWNFIAPLIPVTDDLTGDIYVMVFSALKQAEERGKERQRWAKTSCSAKRKKENAGSEQPE